jgi:hypothetical protein
MTRLMLLAGPEAQNGLEDEYNRGAKGAGLAGRGILQWISDRENPLSGHWDRCPVLHGGPLAARLDRLFIGKDIDRSKADDPTVQ